MRKAPLALHKSVSLAGWSIEALGVPKLSATKPLGDGSKDCHDGASFRRGK